MNMADVEGIPLREFLLKSEFADYLLYSFGLAIGGIEAKSDRALCGLSLLALLHPHQTPPANGTADPGNLAPPTAPRSSRCEPDRGRPRRCLKPLRTPESLAAGPLVIDAGASEPMLFPPDDGECFAIFRSPFLSSAHQCANPSLDYGGQKSPRRDHRGAVGVGGWRGG